MVFPEVLYWSLSHCVDSVMGSLGLDELQQVLSRLLLPDSLCLVLGVRIWICGSGWEFLYVAFVPVSLYHLSPTFSEPRTQNPFS